MSITEQSQIISLQCIRSLKFEAQKIAELVASFMIHMRSNFVSYNLINISMKGVNIFHYKTIAINRSLIVAEFEKDFNFSVKRVLHHIKIRQN